MNHSNELSNVEKIKQLVDYLNLQRNAYYNENSPNISDAEYDRIFDELVELEKQTGFVLSNSPTQTIFLLLRFLRISRSLFFASICASKYFVHDRLPVS